MANWTVSDNDESVIFENGPTLTKSELEELIEGGKYSIQYGGITIRREDLLYAWLDIYDEVRKHQAFAPTRQQLITDIIFRQSRKVLKDTSADEEE